MGQAEHVLCDMFYMLCCVLYVLCTWQQYMLVLSRPMVTETSYRASWTSAYLSADAISEQVTGAMDPLLRFYKFVVYRCSVSIISF